MAEFVNGKAPEPDFAAFVGIDWADQRHCWKLLVTGTQASESGELKQVAAFFMLLEVIPGCV